LLLRVGKQGKELWRKPPPKDSQHYQLMGFTICAMTRYAPVRRRLPFLEAACAKSFVKAK
jgi:hypothetical protein